MALYAHNTVETIARGISSVQEQEPQNSEIHIAVTINEIRRAPRVLSNFMICSHRCGTLWREREGLPGYSEMKGRHAVI